MAEYAHPEALVSTQWVADHGSDANVRLVEVDVDTSAYEQGHIAGAVTWNWQSQLQQNVARDIVSRSEMEALLGGSGISPDTTIILYGDNNNWFAAWAFWQLRYYGHQDVKLMNGGRALWLAENRPTTTDVPSYPASTYSITTENTDLRALRDYVLQAVNSSSHALVDVRSPDEFSGALNAPPQPTAGRLPAQRPHPRRGQRTLGTSRQRGRHLQVRR